MNDFGLVSIITPSYNCAGFIGETIASIQAQTYRNWELIITDDCSTDDSRQVIETFCKQDSRIRLLSLEQNSGAGAARNNSIRAARGRFIAFCDSDDRWTPDKLERQLEFMTANGYGLTYTSYDTCSEHGRINGYVECLPKLTFTKILRDNGIGCLTAIYDRQKIGLHMMPSIRKRQDWCLWIDIIRKTGPAFGLQEPLALYRVRTGSISSNKLEMLRWNFNVYHKVLGYNALVSAFLLGGFFMPYYFYKKIKQKNDYKKRQKQ